MGAGQQGVVWAVRPGVVGGVAARLRRRLRSELRPSLRRPATPLEYRCQGDISKSVNRVTFLFLYNTGPSVRPLARMAMPHFRLRADEPTTVSSNQQPV